MDSPHCQPLTAYVERPRAQLDPVYAIPYFDPCDGGIEAKGLLLLEAAGTVL